MISHRLTFFFLEFLKWYLWQHSDFMVRWSEPFIGRLEPSKCTMNHRDPSSQCCTMSFSIFWVRAMTYFMKFHKVMTFSEEANTFLACILVITNYQSFISMTIMQPNSLTDAQYCLLILLSILGHYHGFFLLVLAISLRPISWGTVLLVVDIINQFKNIVEIIQHEYFYDHYHISPSRCYFASFQVILYYFSTLRLDDNQQKVVNKQ